MPSHDDRTTTVVICRKRITQLKTITSILLALPLLSLSCFGHNINPITYTGSFSGSGVTTSYSIETDGNTGVLSASDIISATFSLTKGTLTEPYAATYSIQDTGSDLTATATALSFDFADTTGFNSFLLVAPLAAGGFYPQLAFETAFAGLGIPPEEGSVDGSEALTSGVVMTGTSAPVVIATTVAATPEPSAMALAGTGLLLLMAGLRRRRFTHAKKEL
jgi:hypothetical protein